MKLRTKKNEAKITLSGTTEGYRENEQEKGETNIQINTNGSSQPKKKKNLSCACDSGLSWFRDVLPTQDIFPLEVPPMGSVIWKLRH